MIQREEMLYGGADSIVIFKDTVSRAVRIESNLKDGDVEWNDVVDAFEATVLAFAGMYDISDVKFREAVRDAFEALVNNFA